MSEDAHDHYFELQAKKFLEDEVQRLNDVVQTQRETIHTLEIACATMRRRLESLEQDASRK